MIFLKGVFEMLKTVKKKVVDIKEGIWVRTMNNEFPKVPAPKLDLSERKRRLEEDMMWKLHGENVGA